MVILHVWSGLWPSLAKLVSRPTRKLSYEGAHDEEQTDAAPSAVDDVPDHLRKQYLFAKQRMAVDENDDTTKGVQIVKMPAGRGHLGQSIASIGLLLLRES
jgi:hypothetical protein